LIAAKLHGALSGREDFLTLTRTEFPNAMEFVRPGFDEPWR